MEKSFFYNFLRGFNDLSYKYDFFYNLKNFLRKIKSFFLGKSGIDLVIDQIKKSRAGDNPVKTIFDIGAASGDKTTLFLRSFPETTAYCFEPQKESLEKFKERTKNFKNRIKLFDFGFLDKNGEVFLNVMPYRDSSTILPLQNVGQSVEIKRENIKVRKMDDFVSQQKISHIDFIKIDVEGSEKEVLEGARNTLKEKVDNVFIEILPLVRGVHSSHFADIFKFFYDAGFTFVGNYGDYFFSKDKKLLENILKF